MNDTKKTSKSFTVKTEIVIDEQRVIDLLIGAFEGGTGYWCQLDRYDAKMADDIVSGKRSLKITEDCGEGIHDKPPVHTMNRKAVERGLALFAKLKPARHFQNFINEDDDAETSDVFLQLCLLGEITYG